MISVIHKKIMDVNLRKEKFSVLLIDIDHFKKINDKYGHLWGDEFLKFIASTLRLTLEEKGLIFRYGGDEFVVVFSTAKPKQAYLLAKQFNQVVRSRPFLFNGRLFRITISCGLATYPDDAGDVDGLLQRADKALYFSKRYGRNTTTSASRMGLRQFKMISVIFLEVFLISGLVFLIHQYLLRGSFKRSLSKLAVSRLLPVKVEPQTQIILKSGDVVLGRIVSENQEKLVVEVSLGRGSCTLDIEKSLIETITDLRP